MPFFPFFFGFALEDFFGLFGGVIARQDIQADSFLHCEVGEGVMRMGGSGCEDGVCSVLLSDRRSCCEVCLGRVFVDGGL